METSDTQFDNIKIDDIDKALAEFEDLIQHPEKIEDPVPENWRDAWLLKIDRFHCAYTIKAILDGEDPNSPSPAVQARTEAMEAAWRAVWRFGGNPWNIFNERPMLQVIFCFAYIITFVVQKIKIGLKGRLVSFNSFNL